jgi:hypothetical protein
MLCGLERRGPLMMMMIAPSFGYFDTSPALEVRHVTPQVRNFKTVEMIT